MWIEGKTELLFGLDIARKLGLTVVFGSDHFSVGQGELAMMTYNEEHPLVFHLVPTACAYAKQDEYFREMQKSANCGPASAGGFWGGHLDVRKLTKSKIRRVQGKWENPNR